MIQRAQTSYDKTDGFETPFQAAAHEWDSRIGSARVQARNWRLMAFACMLLSVVLAGGLLWLSGQTRVETFVVEIDQYGAPGRIQPAHQGYRANKHQVAYYIGQLIERVRSVPTDPVVLRENWLDAYKFLAGDAINKMNAHGNDAEGFNRSTKDLARSVEITNIIHRSDETYQVRWREDTYVNGTHIGTDEYTGLFSYEIIQPKTEQELFANPLGVFVTDFSWSREFHTAPAPGIPGSKSSRSTSAHPPAEGVGSVPRR